jgi:HPt (histidine-containing phosphotransfer) domain-containing protein
VDGDEEFLKEIIEIFIKKSPDSLKRIKDAIDKGNPEELARAAHKLKTELASFGAESARQIAYRLEVMGRNKQLSTAMQEYNALQQEVERLNKALGEFVSG